MKQQSCRASCCLRCFCTLVATGLAMFDKHSFFSFICPCVTVQCPALQEAAGLLIVMIQSNIAELAT